MTRKNKNMETNRYTILPHTAIHRDTDDLNVDFYLDLTGGEQSIVFGHPEDGYLFIAPKEKRWAVRHIYVLPHRRNQGLSRALLDAAALYCKDQRMDFMIYLTYNNDYTHRFLDRYVHERGMTPCVPTRLFIFEDHSFFQSPEWQKTMQRMQLMTERWEAKGAVTAHFDECPDEVLENLKALYYETDEENYQVASDIWPFIPDRYEPLSFITYKENEPMTFVFSQRFGNSILFSGNLALKKYQHNGCFILPLYRFIQSIAEDTSIERMTCKIVGSNHEAVQLAENLWSQAKPRFVKMQVFAHFVEEV